MDPAWAVVPSLRWCMGSVSPKPQGLKWSQPDPAKDNEGALPGKKGEGCWAGKDSGCPPESTLRDMVSDRF